MSFACVSRALLAGSASNEVVCGVLNFWGVMRSRKRSSRLNHWLAAMIWCGVVGCNDNRGNPRTLHDSTGASFRWICSLNRCDLYPATSSEMPCGDFFGYFAGRLVTICAATTFSDDSGWLAHADHCRPVACVGNDECPTIESTQYVCHNGLCQKEDGGLSPLSVTALCLASIPRPDRCNSQNVDPETKRLMELANMSCSGSENECAVPLDCRGP